ncbi:MAG: ketopantoate reductase family protein [Parabacteroides merdae]
MNKTKIAISGIGAVGSYYGGLLAARYKDSEDIDIYFISRGENLEEIRKNGIEVKNTFLTIKAKPTLATDNPAEIGPVDYLFCCTKSYDLEENIVQLTPIIGPNTVIIPLLNGADIRNAYKSYYRTMRFGKDAFTSVPAWSDREEWKSSP